MNAYRPQGAAAPWPPRASRRWLRSWLTLLLAVLTTTACALRGPDAMSASREGYNGAVQASDQREVLLNLVRLRYEETPEFLAISATSTQMNFNAAASIGGEIGEYGDADVSLGSPGAAVGYSESPTVTFVPRRDQEITRQLVAPVELDSIYLLSSYGWGIDRVLLLVVSEMNGLSSGTGQMPLTGENREFRRVVANLRELEKENRLRVGVERRRGVLSGPIPANAVDASQLVEAARAGYRLERMGKEAYLLTGERNHYVLTVDRGGFGSIGVESRVFESLGLPNNKFVFELEAAGMPDAVDLRLATRSVLSAMAWLANAVDVPSAHADLVPTSASEVVPRSILQVRVSADPIADASLSVEHRGNWFYIDDRDLDSKRTLGLLTSLMRLSISAGGAQNVPVLTLPIMSEPRARPC